MAAQSQLTAKERVEVGLNVIAMHDIDDAHHTVQCNILLQVRWCPDRDVDHPDRDRAAKCTPWYPWVQLHNLHSMVHFVGSEENRGLVRQSPEDLKKKIAEHREKKPNETLMVLETSNFVAKFINPLELRKFPYDTQVLGITIISGKTSEMTLTHKVDRDRSRPLKFKSENGREVAWLPPKMNDPMPRANSGGKDRPAETRTIKCNLEGDTVSEWTIKLRDTSKENATAQDYITSTLESTSSESVPAIFVYRFSEHDPSNSSEGNIYQRLDCKALAQREVMNIMMSVIAPTAALCFGSISAFSMDIEDDIGDRLSILFTIILAIIANSIATQGRLPKVNYLTWADICLNLMQGLVYLVVVQTAACKKIAEQVGLAPRDLDTYCLYGFLCTFILVYLGMIVYTLYLDLERAHLVQKFKRWDDESFWLEEARLAKVESNVNVTPEEMRRSCVGDGDRYQSIVIDVTPSQ